MIPPSSYPFCSFSWVFSVLRGQIVEVKRKPDLLGRAVSATNYTHCAKFNLKILRSTNYLEQAKIRPIALCNVQICLVANSTAKQVFENKILYAYLCLVYFIYIFYMNIVLFDKSIPSVSEIQEKYDRMTIFKWTHCPVRLLFNFVHSSNIVCFLFALTIDAFWCYQIQCWINCEVGSPRKYFIFGLLARKGNVATKITVFQCFAFPAHSGSLLLSGSISCSLCHCDIHGSFWINIEEKTETAVKKSKNERASIFWNSYWRSLLNGLSSYTLQSFGWWK